MPIKAMSTEEDTNDKAIKLRIFGWLLIVLANIKAKNTISYNNNLEMLKSKLTL
ncbi:MAG: hypothetical protein Rsou_0542 [Candidatus Ruthia sp. Asou_11_S2]|nr:hypothetical protein [Candidatus Ruthia sp. Asou_11_S2]